MTTSVPADLQLIGDFVALRWDNDHEDVFPMEFLRANSPSAERAGEPDLFGNIRGGDPRTEFPGVRVVDWEWVGRYAIRFQFSDGHGSGLYTFDLLRRLGEQLNSVNDS